MSNNGNTKKRKVEGGARVSIDGAGESCSSESAELSAIKSMMQDLVNQNRIQTTTILEQNAMMQIMRGEIKQLTEKCDAMETTIEKDIIISRFDEIDDKLNYYEILLQNQQWKYSAPYPSDDYWNSVDTNEREDARVFLTEIKKCTEEMRYGTGDTIRLSINADLPYSEVFLPHWKEFANALKQYTGTTSIVQKKINQNRNMILAFAYGIWNYRTKYLISYQKHLNQHFLIV